MTNHVRTLLANVAAAPSGTTIPGEEYAPSTFVPARLPAALLRAREALFGAGADRVGINLNLARLLAFLHASRFTDDVVAADARVTYDPARPVDVFGLLGATVTTVSGAAPKGWRGARTFQTPGRAYGYWDVITDGVGGSNQGDVTGLTAGDAVPLPGSDLLLVVPTAAVVPTDFSLYTDGKLTVVACSDHNVAVVNRLGAARTYSYFIYLNSQTNPA